MQHFDGEFNAAVSLRPSKISPGCTKDIFTPIRRTRFTNTHVCEEPVVKEQGIPTGEKLTPCYRCGSRPDVFKREDGVIAVQDLDCGCKMTGQLDRDPRKRWEAKFDRNLPLSELEKNKLRKCPECGGQPRYIHNGNKPSKVVCQECGLTRRGSIFKAGDDPVMHWNRDDTERDFSPTDVERINRLDEATEKRNG